MTRLVGQCGDSEGLANLRPPISQFSAGPRERELKARGLKLKEHQVF